MAAIAHHEELIVLPRELRGETGRVYELEMAVNKLELRIALLEGQVAFLAQLLQEEQEAVTNG